MWSTLQHNLTKNCVINALIVNFVGCQGMECPVLFIYFLAGGLDDAFLAIFGSLGVKHSSSWKTNGGTEPHLGLLWTNRAVVLCK